MFECRNGENLEDWFLGVQEVKEVVRLFRFCFGGIQFCLLVKNLGNRRFLVVGLVIYFCEYRNEQESRVGLREIGNVLLVIIYVDGEGRRFIFLS